MMLVQTYLVAHVRALSSKKRQRCRKRQYLPVQGCNLVGRCKRWQLGSSDNHTSLQLDPMLTWPGVVIYGLSRLNHQALCIDIVSDGSRFM